MNQNCNNELTRKKRMLSFLLKKIGGSFVLLLFFSFTTWAQEPVRVLFIGNSFTYSSNLPAILRNLAQSQNKIVTTQENLISGVSFAQHARNDSTYKLIRQANYDYVVLQGFSREFTHHDSIVEEKSLPFVQKLMDSIHYHNPSAIPIFYMTWGYKNGTTIQPTPFSNFDDMNDIIQQRYEKLAEDYQCWVAPVGVAWAKIVKNNPEINLYAKDNYHPTLAASYLAACTFYSMIFNEQCNSTMTAGLDSKQAVQLQKTASQTVGQSLYKWKYIDNEEPFQKNPAELYPNLARDSITISPNCDSATISIYSLFGKKVAHFENTEVPVVVSVNQLSSGLYFVKMKCANSTRTMKLIIEK